METTVAVLILLIFVISSVRNSKKKNARRPGAEAVNVPPAPPAEAFRPVPTPARSVKPAEELRASRGASAAKPDVQPVSRGKLTAQDMRRAFVMSEILREPVSVREERK